LSTWVEIVLGFAVHFQKRGAKSTNAAADAGQDALFTLELMPCGPAGA